ncbi:YbaB/EbfC family nucleoid-associated protein [Salininema proteolyticum]|uniref:YbaB/EbfC family nucleoid-associated protein n=1 Tax=Salininema proteolyticum TaxID=1607685 RepID=A0ABV8U3X5_9ACTN
MFERGKNYNPEEMLAKLDKMQRQAEETLSKFEEFQSSLGDADVSITSDNGMVTVELDGEGRLSGLELAPDATRLKGNLAPLILQTIHDAQATFGEKMTQTVEQMLPDLDINGIMSQFRSPEARDKARENLND